MSEAPAEDPDALGTQDLHVHTRMSDGDLPLEKVVALAQERGVRIGISDHVSRRMPDRFVSTEEKLDRYLAALAQVPVFRAAELCWCDEFSHRCSAELRERFDYLIGSNHGFALPDGTMASLWQDELPERWAGQADDFMEIMVHNLCALVTTLPISLVAHSTLLPAALSALEPDPLAWWSEEREDRFIEAAVGAGVAIEISNRYRLPHPRLLRKAREAGSRFTLGSDAHHGEQVARLEWAVAAARAAGITGADLFLVER